MWKLFGVNSTSHTSVCSLVAKAVRQHFHPLFPFAASRAFGLPAGGRGVRGAPGAGSLPAAGVGTHRELILALHGLSSHRLWEQLAPSLCLHFLGHPWPKPPSVSLRGGAGCEDAEVLLLGSAGPGLLMLPHFGTFAGLLGTNTLCWVRGWDFGGSPTCQCRSSVPPRLPWQRYSCFTCWLAKTLGDLLFQGMNN